MAAFHTLPSVWSRKAPAPKTWAAPYPPPGSFAGDAEIGPEALTAVSTRFSHVLTSRLTSLVHSSLHIA